jgi:hypothetical protein
LRIRFQAPYLVTGGSGPGFGGGTTSSLQYADLISNHFVGGLNLTQYAGRFAIRLGGIYSSINNASQLTGAAGLTWYPMGNLDLYLGSTLNVHNEFDEEETSTKFIPDLLIGFGISSKVWMEFSGTYGDMKNYTEGNGYNVYNGLDWMKYKVIGSVVIPVSPKGSKIYLGARFAEYESHFIPFDSLAGKEMNSIITNSISIFGGLSWKF